MTTTTTSKVEYLPIIMAGGKGRRLIQMTSDVPKPLLPIANKPMIYYPISWLESNGFEEVKIVTTKSILMKLRDCLKEHFQGAGIKLDYVVLPEGDDNEDLGTVDALKFMLKEIKLDVLIMSCDFICDVNFSLRKLDQLHKTNDASVTMLLSPAPNLTNTPVPKPKSNRKIERDFVGFDGTGKVVFVSPESSLEGCIDLKISHLRKVPRIELHSDLLDCHLYIISRPLLNLIHLGQPVSLRTDFIPWLVGQSIDPSPGTLEHFYKLGNAQTEFEKELTYIDSLLTDQNSLLYSPNYDITNNNNKNNNNVNNNNNSNDNTINNNLDDNNNNNNNNINNNNNSTTTGFRITCHAMVTKKIHDDGGKDGDVGVDGVSGGDEGDDRSCMRANTLAMYCEINRLMTRKLLKKQQPQRGTSLIGRDVRLGSKTYVRHSTVGNHCQIGDNCEIVNCVLMDHVVIGKGTKVTNSVICSNAELSDDVTMKDSFVGYNQSISTGKYADEEISKVDQMVLY